jgi:hypothetical protein
MKEKLLRKVAASLPNKSSADVAKIAKRLRHVSKDHRPIYNGSAT